MKWLLSKLGLLKQPKKAQDLQDDLSFFKTSLQTNAIACNGIGLKRGLKKRKVVLEILGLFGLLE